MIGLLQVDHKKGFAPTLTETKAYGEEFSFSPKAVIILDFELVVIISTTG